MNFDIIKALTQIPIFIIYDKQKRKLFLIKNMKNEFVRNKLLDHADEGNGQLNK